MNDMDAIANILAAKGVDQMLGKKKEEPKIEAPERSFDTRRTRIDYGMPAPMPSGAPKIWPSERMQLRTTASQIIMPKRPPVLIAEYSDDDLEWMLSTPVKRHWEFKDWLEVIGLPPDLHEKWDGAMYQYAARAYLKLKQRAHQS